MNCCIISNYNTELHAALGHLHLAMGHPLRALASRSDMPMPTLILVMIDLVIVVPFLFQQRCLLRNLH